MIPIAITLVSIAFQIVGAAFVLIIGFLLLRDLYRWWNETQ